MAINPDTGAIFWDPDASVRGDHPVEVEVRDPAGGMDTQTFTVKVAVPNLNPQFTSHPPRLAKVGERYVYDADAFDPEGEMIDFEFAEMAPANMSIDPQTGVIEWIAAGPTREQRISIRARDASGGFDLQVFDLNVVDEPLGLVSPEGEFEVEAGQELILPLAADYPQAGFSVEPLPDNARIDGSNFRFTPALTQVGEHSLLFLAHLDERKAGNQVTIRVTRPNSAPVFVPVGAKQVDEGKELAFTVAAQDADGDALTFTAPGLMLANAFFNELTQQFLFRPAFDQAGMHNVAFEVSDGITTTQLMVAITVNGVEEPSEPFALAVDELENPTFATSRRITGSVRGETGPPPAPAAPVFITGLSPANARQGTSAIVDLTGYKTGFLAGATTASFGDGIAVQSLEILSPTSARATVQVATDAAVGARQVRVAQPGGEVYAIVAFNVQAGAATLTGRLIDSFTNAPLAGARVGINGSPLFTFADMDGRFTLTGVPPGEHTLIVTLANYGVVRLAVVVGANETLALGDTIGLDALARPATVGGTLPRSSSVASVLDRGVTAKGGGLTFEQAKAVVQDTMIAVGGSEAGAIDAAGNQLNPMVTGAGAWSLTQDGIERQARSIMLGDVYTLGSLVDMLRGSFSFPLGLEMSDVIDGFQSAADEAWANPGDPRNGMAIVLFNEGTSLSPMAPRISADTRFNRFQMFLLLSSFMVANASSLDRSADNLLEAQGVDVESQLPPPPFPQLASAVPMSTEEPPTLLATLSAFFVAEAYAATPSELSCQHSTIPCSISDLQNRKSFSKVWKALGANLYAESATAALVGIGFSVAQQTVQALTIGVTGGRVGAYLGLLNVAGAAAMGFASVAFQKTVMAWFIALVVASFEPPPPEGHPGKTTADGGYLITFDRSLAEVQSMPQPGATPRPGPQVARKFAYHLYRVPDCRVPVDQSLVRHVNIEALEDLTDPANREDADHEPRGRMLFFVPRAMLRPGGENHFRIRTFQYIENSATDLIEGVGPYDTDENGTMSLEEFRRGGLGDLVAFGALDRNLDNALDDSEFQRENGPHQLKITTDVPNPYLGAVLGHQPRSLNDWKADIDLERINIEAETQVRSQNPKNVRSVPAGVEKAYGDLSVAQLNAMENNLNAAKLVDDAIARGNALAVETSQLGTSQARAEIQARAPQIARELYMNHLGVDNPSAAQIASVENVLVAQRNAEVSSMATLRMLDHVGDLDAAIAEVKSGAEPIRIVDLPVYEFGSLKPSGQTKQLLIDASNVGDFEIDINTSTAKSFENGRGSSPVVQYLAQTEGQIAGTGDLSGDSFLQQSRGNNARGKVRDCYREAFKQSSGLPDADVDAHFEAFNKSLAKIDTRAPELARAGVKQHAQIQKYVRQLRQARSAAFADAVVPSGRLDPRVPRPPGLNPLFEKAVGRGADLAGAAVNGAQTMIDFLSNVKQLSSDFSDSCFTAPDPGIAVPSEVFPPSLEAHPSGEEVNAVIIAPPIPHPAAPKEKTGELTREHPADDKAFISRADVGFPPALLAADKKGGLYALNTASSDRFGGRIFRFVEDLGAEVAARESGQPIPFRLARDFVGSTTFFNLNVATARPALPVAMTIGPDYPAMNLSGDEVQTQDLFVAHIDLIDGEHEILRVPLHMIDTNPASYGPGSTLRHQIAGQPIIVSDDLKLTGPSDMEIGPDPDLVPAVTNPDSVIALSDEENIFLLCPDPGTGTRSYRLAKIVEVSGRRFSGLAFDKLGKFYFADYVFGDVFVMPFHTFRTAAVQACAGGAPLIQTEGGLQQSVYPIAHDLVQPGDIELSGLSAQPGAVLNVSLRIGDILPITLPLIGKLGDAQDVRVNLFGIEQKAEIDAVHDYFVVTPSLDDARRLTAVVRYKRLDANGRVVWQERVVKLAEHGATILEDAL